jgi:hypothetical protein
MGAWVVLLQVSGPAGGGGGLDSFLGSK